MSRTDTASSESTTRLGDASAETSTDSAVVTGTGAGRGTSRTVRQLQVSLAFTVAATSAAHNAPFPILPSIGEAFDVSPATLTWVVGANLLAAAVATPFLGRLGDAFGHRRLLLIALAFCVAGSFLCAATSSFALLLVGRALQGASTGVIPLAFSILRAAVPRQQLARATATVGASTSIGGGSGLVLGGLFDVTGGYRASFVFAGVAALLALVAAFVVVPESIERAAPSADVLGALTLAVWLCALLVVLTQGNAWGWTSTRVLGLALFAVGACAAWATVELRVSQPLVDLRLLRERTLLVTNLATVAVGVPIVGYIVLALTFPQASQSGGYGFSATPFGAALLMLPFALATLLVAPLATRLIHRVGNPAPLVVGALLMALGMVSYILWHDTRVVLMLNNFVVGLGVGFCFLGIAVITSAAAPFGTLGIAQAVSAVARTVGGAVGTAAVGAVLAAGAAEGTSAPTERAYMWAFGLLIGSSFLAALLSLALRRRPAGPKGVSQ